MFADRRHTPAYGGPSTRFRVAAIAVDQSVAADEAQIPCRRLSKRSLASLSRASQLNAAVGRTCQRRPTALGSRRSGG